MLGLKKKDTGARQECEVLRVATPQTVFPGADERHVSERADAKDARGLSRVWRVSEMADKVRQNLARLGMPSSDPGAAAQLVAPAPHFKSLSDVLGANDALPPPQPILHPADLPVCPINPINLFVLDLGYVCTRLCLVVYRVGEGCGYL